VRDAAGRPTGLIGVNVDVTERRNASDALARLNAELERRVEEGASRVAQLRKMESLGRLTGGIAHDFNNLLMAVMASLEPLRDRLPPGDELSAQLADNAMQRAERGAALTRRLLAFARRREYQAEPVDAAALVEGMSGLLRRSIGPRVHVETVLDPAAPPAMADPIQLEAAILNLAVDSRDAMPDGGVLTIRVDAPEPGSVRLTVADTVTGMDADTLAHAMEPFFTTKGVGEGTGLGLPMVQALADQAGGSFRLDSAPGRGTTAELLLPVARCAPAPVARRAPDEAVAAARPRHGLSVLVVDDDPLVLMGAAAMLRDLGHRPTEAASGRHALGMLRGGGGSTRWSPTRRCRGWQGSTSPARSGASGRTCRWSWRPATPRSRTTAGTLWPGGWGSRSGGATWRPRWPGPPASAGARVGSRGQTAASFSAEVLPRRGSRCSS